LFNPWTPVKKLGYTKAKYGSKFKEELLNEVHLRDAMLEVSKVELFSQCVYMFLVFNLVCNLYTATGQLSEFMCLSASRPHL